MQFRLLMTSGAAIASILATADAAQAFSHHRHRHAIGHALAPSAHEAPPAYVDRAPGWEVRRLAEKAQSEPGVTLELAPDAVQTATGGPSGGVPGFSGH